MYIKRLELKTNNFCNYSIEVSPKDSSIIFSLAEKAYLLPKEDFLSLNEQDLNNLIKNEKEKIKQNIKEYPLEDTIAKMKFSNDNNNIIIGDQTKSITKFNLSENENDNDNNNIINIKKSKTWKFALDKEKSNPLLCTGENDIYIYDYNENKIIKTIEQKNKFIYSYCFLPNKKISTGNSNGAIYIYDIETGNKDRKIEEHCLSVRNLEFNKNKNLLYSASDDLHINQIDINTFKIYSPIVGHKEPISDMVFNEQRNLLITSSFDGTIKLWDINANNNCIDTLELKTKNPIWDIGVSEIGDLITFTASEGIGAFCLK